MTELRSLEIIPGRFFFDVWEEKPTMDLDGHFFCLDEVYTERALYFPFANDFGPPSIGQTYVFSSTVDQKLEHVTDAIHFYHMESDGKMFTNAFFLVGAYCILRLKWSSERTWKLLSNFERLLEHYVDASPTSYDYGLPMLSCFRGLEKALKLNWINLDEFNHEEYAFYEQVENGDFNWIIPGRLLSFASPTQEYTDDGMVVTHPPTHYIPYFKEHGISAIVRLNKVEYDAEDFTRQGFDHFEMYFIDGTTPPWSIVEQFLRVMETQKGVAVHCKQGLGRTGTLNACYILKHYDFTADEVIAFLRIQRPGSVVGPQQHFLHKAEPRLKALRESNGPQTPPPRRSNRASANKRKSPDGDLDEQPSLMSPSLIPLKITVSATQKRQKKDS